MDIRKAQKLFAIRKNVGMFIGLGFILTALICLLGLTFYPLDLKNALFVGILILLGLDSIISTVRLQLGLYVHEANRWTVWSVRFLLVVSVLVFFLIFIVGYMVLFLHRPVFI
ncbi:MAG: hypothetical protein ACTTJK_06420 [Phocaeicola sp.]|uniref:hypothetical protein n=1 Tax=Phocaeicola TaxID=909656 RepID=UPI00234E9353|nr:hypothetical protein [Phocaeicola oris]MCE2617355.1 hypothetical protein [Phocaeicola oris]